ncbi:MAG TPA: rod shape-determining protein MreC [Bacilli bacterium]|nr:rod shape-determining protein MreC [Bacilli bacterium]
MKKNKILIILIIIISFIICNLCIEYNFNFQIKDIIMYPINKIISSKKVINNDSFLIESLKNKNKEIEELKKTLELKTINSNYKVINASITYRNMEYFYNEITINKGKKDGITKDSPVIVSEGLIGRINKVTNYSSTIKLITSASINNMLSVQINTKSGYVYGILNNYDKETNSFIIEGISSNTEISPGDVVSTTGLGNIYTSGIIIGKVVRIQKDNFDLANILKVEPIVDFNNFHYVSVLEQIND